MVFERLQHYQVRQILNLTYSVAIRNQFLAIFGQKFDKSSEPAKLDRRRGAYNSAK